VHTRWSHAPRLVALLTAALLAVGLVAGCGDDDDEADAPAPPAATATAPTTTEAPATTAPSEPTVLEIPAAADNSLAFEVSEVTAPAGEVTLRTPNPSALPHNIAVDEPETVEGEIVQTDGVSEITVTFPPGSYEYYCSVPGHREGGMVGTLTVE
jgi:plastocyanin